MPLLQFDLQDGFDNDEVCIRVNGVEVYRGKAVTTQRLVGLAGTAQVPVMNCPVAVEIAVPNRDLAWKEMVDVAGDIHLGICVDGGIRVQRSSKPYGYA